MGWGLATITSAQPVSTEEIGTVDIIPDRYQLGQELYLENCASCHIGIPPAVLPTQTWQRVKVETSLQQYILDLVRATREDEEIALGVSPRGTIALQKATQALAFLSDRTYAIPDDIKLLAPHVLSHRLIPAGARKAKTVVEKLLRHVSIP